MHDINPTVVILHPSFRIDEKKLNRVQFILCALPQNLSEFIELEIRTDMTGFFDKNKDESLYNY